MTSLLTKLWQLGLLPQAVNVLSLMVYYITYGGHKVSVRNLSLAYVFSSHLPYGRRLYHSIMIVF